MSTDNDNPYYYLNDDFEYHKLTMATLRGILSQHNIYVTSAAKKADLVEAFEKHIFSKRDELRRDLMNISPNGLSIENAIAEPGRTNITRSPSRSRRANALSASESPVRRSTRNKSPITYSNLVFPDPDLEQEVSRSPRRRRLNKIVAHPSDVEDTTAPNTAAIKLSPRTRARSSSPKRTTSGARRGRPPKSAQTGSSDVVDAAVDKLPPSDSSDRSQASSAGLAIERSEAEASRRISFFNNNNVFQHSEPRGVSHGRKRSSREVEPTGSLERLSKTRILEPPLPIGDFKDVVSTNLPPAADNMAKGYEHLYDSTDAYPKEEIKEQNRDYIELKQSKKKVLNVSDSQTSGSRSLMPDLSHRDIKVVVESAGASATTPVTLPNDHSEILSEESTDTEANVKKYNDNTLTGEVSTSEEMGQVATETNHRLKQAHVCKVAVSGLVWAVRFLLVFSLGSFFLWYRSAKIAEGICDFQLSSHVRVYPEWLNCRTDSDTVNFVQNVFRSGLDSIWPSCEPCPPHAICTQSRSVECEQGYVLVSNFLSMTGIWPALPECRLDKERERRVRIIRDRALHFLRNQKARSICEEDVDAGVSEQELKNVLHNLKSDQITDDEFNSLWEQASEEIQQYPDVETLFNGSDIIPEEDLVGDEDNEFFGNFFDKPKSKKIFVSHSNSHVTMFCNIRRTLTANYRRIKFAITNLFLILSVSGPLYILFTWTRAWRNLRRKMLDNVVARLKAQRAKADADASGKMFPFVMVSEVRELVPRSCWKSIEKQLRENPFAREAQKEIYGEIVKTWEWIGPGNA